MKKADKVMFGCFCKSVRKWIVESYKIQRMSIAESEKKGGKK